MGLEDRSWERRGAEDLVGLDRLARSLLRSMARMRPASVVAIHGSPGSSKDEFLCRLAWLADQDRAGIGDGAMGPFNPQIIWYNPWKWSKQGDTVAGLIYSLASAAPPGNSRVDQLRRDLIAHINRLRLDGAVLESTGNAVGDSSPVERLIEGFGELVREVADTHPGRILIFVEDLDRLPPLRRWNFLEAMQLLLSPSTRRKGESADVSVVVGVGRESVFWAIRSVEGDIPEASADRVLERLFDLSVTVPNLDVRRITSMLRRFLGPNEPLLRMAFGQNALQGLSAAVAHRQLGSPRFLQRLATRVVLLCEYATEMRVSRELTEAQWAWVIVSVRWPGFRRFMIRGGRDRWIELREVATYLSRPAGSDRSAPRTSITTKLQTDLILADYLRLHAQGFAQDTEGIFWLENLMLAAGV